MRRRIWSEFLPAEELGAPATIELLRKHQLEPIVAVPPVAQSAQMATALRALQSAGVRVGVWPLLPDDQGYWPSEDNALSYVERVQDVLGFLGQSAVAPQTVAIDLEPPLPVTKALFDASQSGRARMLLESALATRHRQDARVRAEVALTTLARRLRAVGIETIAAAIPPIVFDLFRDGPLWQRVLRTPVAKPQWEVVSLMMYTTMIRQLLPSGSMRSARVVMFEAGRMLAASMGAGRSSLSLGLVSSGKLGDEPAYRAPEELARDVAHARAAGVDDLALFSLEGVLARGSPEAWLVPFVREEPARPSRVLSAPIGAAMRTVALGSWLSRVVLR